MKAFGEEFGDTFAGDIPNSGAIAGFPWNVRTFLLAAATGDAKRLCGRSLATGVSGIGCWSPSPGGGT